MIHEYFSKSLSDFSSVYHLIYFDFDNFKPFNDTYGFRNGDRLILMFADLLKKIGLYKNRFVGHIGGDDFFLGVQNSDTQKLSDEMKQVAIEFKENAESFYHPTTVEQGFLLAKNREGIIKHMPLMTISIAILELPKAAQRNCSIETAANIIARLKKEAKHSKTGIVNANIMNFLTQKSIQPVERKTMEIEERPKPDNVIEFKIG
jgi:GGDEF domain-containing protein